MKYKYLFILLICIMHLSGCARHDSSDTYTYSDLTLTGSISGLSSSNVGSESNYIILIQNQISNRVYMTPVDSNGSFKFNGDGAIHKAIQTVDHKDGYGDHFMIILLKKDPLEMTAVAYLPGSSSEGYSGLKIAQSLSSPIELSLNENKGKMELSETNLDNISGIEINKDFKVRLSNDAPVGQANFGKSNASKTSSTSSTNTLDPDQDGRPNIFDGMNDGAQLDNLVAETKTEAATLSDSIESSIMFMNLKINYDSTQNYKVKDYATVVLEVTPRSSASISSIRVAELTIPPASSVRFIHTNYKNATMFDLPNGFTALETYPAKNTAWSSNDYKLFKAKNMSDDTVYTAVIKPGNNDFSPGDLILLEVNLTDGSKEYYFNSINFKFETIPTDQSSWTYGGSGSESSPFNIDDIGGRVFAWSDPKDEMENALTGLDYKFEVFYYKANSGNCDPTFTYQIDTNFNISDRQSGVVDKNDISEAEIDRFSSGSDVTKCIQMDISGSYPYGDNSALKYYFKRTSW